jgi:hypothetical protein
MKLIATLGTTPANYTHEYFIDEIPYRSKFSFLALKAHFNIKDEDVIIIGTEATRKKQKDYIKNFNFIEVNADDFDDVFAKAIKSFENDAILDLTQAFKSIGYGSLLSYIFSKSIGKKVKDIYYAQVQNNCNAGKEECVFKFQSIKRYEDIVDLVREINTFLHSWYVINQEKEEEFKIIHNNLLKISQNLLVNNLDIRVYIDRLLKEINRLLEEEKYAYLHSHLEKLKEEILKIQDALNSKESLKMYNFNKLCFEKNLLLQSLTLLFEAVSAYLEELVDDEYKCNKNKKQYTKKSNKYKFRNCLKSDLIGYRKYKYCKDFWSNKIKNCDKFRKNFIRIDEMRNDSAHVFINGSKLREFRDEIRSLIEFFDNYIK